MYSLGTESLGQQIFQIERTESMTLDNIELMRRISGAVWLESSVTEGIYLEIGVERVSWDQKIKDVRLLAKERYKRVSQLDMVQSQHLEALGVEQVPGHAMLLDPVSNKQKKRKPFLC